ncbi:ParM/StbA family protein [Sporosarcina jiandibaonis]|uniref:ParM/StbA family protein n=1 Tax=Sporosarcina jiandibaonis TaxID=2715535 RepID=UPI001FEB6A58|nr:ParM/StbA family protein [Sporosarcina jiandibaonis]
MLILGIDAGNHMAKTAGPYGIDSYRTAICDWFKQDFVEKFGDDDMEFEIDGRKGYAGSIAEHEDVFGGGGMYGDTKAHEDTKIRVLLALYRYINKYCPGIDTVKIVTGQPITSHNQTEKQKLIDMLQRGHEFTVNNRRQYVYIEDVRVVAEGAGAFWSNPQTGKVRIIDIGSGTVNVATVFNKKIINNSSETLNFGMETVNRGLDSIARGIIQETTRLRWERTDTVYVCGGVANDILPYIKLQYSQAESIQPLLKRHNSVEMTSTLFANAVGFYEIGRLTYR